MDLQTVANNLRDKKYSYLEEVLNDIQMIWDNCKLYNPETAVPFITMRIIGDLCAGW